MARKRKYPEVQGWWVYSIYVPSINKYYIGVSSAKECSQRWIKSHYKSTILNQYLEEWQDMEKKVLIDGLTRKESLKMEDNIIRGLQMNNLTINERRSGLIEVSDKNAYMRELRKNNTELRKKNCERQRERYQTDAEYRERKKQYQKDNREKINENRRQRYLKKKLEREQHTSLQ